MERIEYRYVDKSKWPPGPWQEEPDKIQWQDEETGLPCLIVRQPEVGHLCGYVGVAEGHPLYMLDYSDCSLKTAKPRGEEPDDSKIFNGAAAPEWMIEQRRKQKVCEEGGWCGHSPGSLLEAHGGITFADSCREHEDGRGICHKPAPGEPEKVWWFGFDCAHLYDLSPGRDPRFSFSFESDSTYRDVAYVARECHELARQLKAMAN